MTMVFKGTWQVTREKKIPVALKFLHPNQEKHLMVCFPFSHLFSFTKNILEFYGFDESMVFSTIVGRDTIFRFFLCRQRRLRGDGTFHTGATRSLPENQSGHCQAGGFD